MDPLAAALPRFEEELGAAALRLLRAIAAAIDALPDVAVRGQQRILLNRADVLTELAKLEAKPVSNDSFRQRLRRINEAARSPELAIYGGEAPFLIHARAEQLAVSLTEGYREHLARARLRDQVRRATDEGTELDEASVVEPSAQRRQFQVFVSHAWQSEPEIEEIVDRFCKHLDERLSHLPEPWRHRFSLKVWFDREKMHGRDTFDSQSEAASAEAEIGLLLLSHRWFHRPSCQAEAENFHDTAGRDLSGKVFHLVQVSGQSHSSEKVYIGRPRFPETWKGDFPTLLKLYAKGDADDRDEFFDRLTKEICETAELLLDQPQLAKKSHSFEIKPKPSTSERAKVDLRKLVKEQGPGLDRHDLEAREGSATDPFGTKAEGSDDRFELLPALMDWATKPEEPRRLTALLGSFGAGKTIAAQLFARKLSQGLSKDPTAPLPVYLDLRRLIAHFSAATRPEEFRLETLIALSLNIPNSGLDEQQALLELLRGEACVILFDGLDEVGTRLGAARTAALFRQLLEVVPVATWEADSKRGAADWIACPTRIFVTCRSHFFRDNFEERGLLTGQHRHGPQASGDKALHQCFYMAHFTFDQVQDYLTKTLGEVEGPRAMATIRSVHDLLGLASKPLMARLIIGHLPEIEAAAKAGQHFNTAQLYGYLFRTTLARDQDKRLMLSERDREVLLEELSLKLWQEGRASLPVGQLEDWLDEQAEGRSGLGQIMRASPEMRMLIQTDLRNASLLVRINDDAFQFAHTSFYEYFLARAIYRTVSEGGLDEVEPSRPVSIETRVFVHEIYATKSDHEQRKWMKAVAEVLASDQKRPRRQLLADLLLRVPSEARTVPLVEGANLSYLDLRGLKIEGQAESAVQWRSVSLHGSHLNLARLSRVVIERCDLRDCDLTQASFKDCAFRDSAGPPIGLGSARFLDTRFAGTSIEWASSSRFAYRCHGLEALPKVVSRDPMICSLGGAYSFVHSVACSLDGQHVLTGEDAIIRLWDVKSSCEILRVQGHKGSVSSVAFSPSGRRFLTGSDDGTVGLWDADSCTEMASCKRHNGMVSSVAFAPDDKLFLTGSYDRTARIWNADSGTEVLRTLRHESSVLSVAFSSDGEYILTGSSDHTARLWNTKSGEEVRRYPGHEDSVRSVAFSPEGELLLTGSDDCTVRLWSAENGCEVARFTDHKFPVTSVAFLSGGQRVLTGSIDGIARLWDTKSGTEIARSHIYSDLVTSIAVTPDGQLIAAGSAIGSVGILDVENAAENARFQGHTRPVTSVAFSPKGRHMAIGLRDVAVRLRDAESGKEIARLQGHRGGVRSVAFSPDSRQLLADSSDQTACLYDVGSGRQILRLHGHKGPVSSVTFSPDGARILTGSYDHTARLWETASGREVVRLEGHTDWVQSVTFAPEGNLVLTGSDDYTARLWCAESGREVGQLEGHDNFVVSTAFAPDGKRLLTGSGDRTARLWCVENRTEIKELEGHDGPVNSVTFAPDGKHFLTGSHDCTARLWDTESYKERIRFQGNMGPVTSVAFSPDGGRVLTGSGDGTVHLWDARTGELLRVFVSYPDSWATLDKAGNLIATTEKAWPYFNVVVGTRLSEKQVFGAHHHPDWERAIGQTPSPETGS